MLKEIRYRIRDHKNPSRKKIVLEGLVDPDQTAQSDFLSRFCNRCDVSHKNQESKEQKRYSCPGIVFTSRRSSASCPGVRINECEIVKQLKEVS